MSSAGESVCAAVGITTAIERELLRNQVRTSETGVLVAGLQANSRIFFVNLVLMIAIFVLTAMPAYAQGQQPDTVKLKVGAQNAFNIISSDKLKIQTFCEMTDLGNQLDQADRAHDTKKTEEVSQKLDELERKLPEYTALVDGLADLDPNSKDAQEIGSIILKLDELCH